VLDANILYNLIMEESSDLLEGRKRKPKEKDKLENKVEGKPVDNVDEALQDGEEGKHHPVLIKR
jgi:hypothetical protein